MSLWGRRCCVEALLRVKSPCARIDLPHERCRKKDARFSLKRHGGVGSCIDVRKRQVGQCGSVSKRTPYTREGRGGWPGKLASLCKRRVPGAPMKSVGDAWMMEEGRRAARQEAEVLFVCRAHQRFSPPRPARTPTFRQDDPGATRPRVGSALPRVESKTYHKANHHPKAIVLAPLPFLPLSSHALLLPSYHHHTHRRHIERRP